MGVGATEIQWVPDQRHLHLFSESHERRDVVFWQGSVRRPVDNAFIRCPTALLVRDQIHDRVPLRMGIEQARNRRWTDSRLRS